MVVPGAVTFQLDSGWSFPSGHTSRVFSLLPSTKGMNRKIRLLGYSLAILVGFSRVYIGLHYPLDLVGGVALGFAAGRITDHYEGRIVPRAERALMCSGESHSTNP
jgi:undecaprenyl-diphosphatase